MNRSGEFLKSRFGRNGVLALLCLGTFFACTPNIVLASCGDYLLHHRAMNHENHGHLLKSSLPASVPNQTPDQTVPTSSDSGSPRSPTEKRCSGPHCRGSNPVPTAPQRLPLPTPSHDAVLGTLWEVRELEAVSSLPTMGWIFMADAPRLRIDRPPQMA